MFLQFFRFLNHELYFFQLVAHHVAILETQAQVPRRFHLCYLSHKLPSHITITMEALTTIKVLHV